MSSRLATAHSRVRHALRQRGESGAAAVEFALVLPVLLLILFGIVDYGLYFSNSIQVRSGLHDAAREYAVAPTTACTPTDGYTAPAGVPPEIADLMCSVHNHSASATGKSYVMVLLPQGWAPGQPLEVCERTDVSGLTGFVPLPGHGQLQAESVVSIEQDFTDVTWQGHSDPQPAYQDPTPDAYDWSWCQ